MIQKRNVFARSGPYTVIDRNSNPPANWMVNHLDIDPVQEGLDVLRRSVGRAVVNDHQFVVLVGLGEDAVKRLIDVTLAVQDRHDDTDFMLHSSPVLDERLPVFSDRKSVV